MVPACLSAAKVMHPAAGDQVGALSAHKLLTACTAAVSRACRGHLEHSLVLPACMEASGWQSNRCSAEHSAGAAESQQVLLRVSRCC